MSLVVFPFKEEALAVISANLETAAAHPRVDEVWAVASEPASHMDAVGSIARGIEGAPIRVFPQERLGLFRPGKGDGLNTALRRASSEGFGRVHFYDADITNFGVHWIDGAEMAADDGYPIVRHRFPRSSTDAMITWMITRPALAMLFPGSILPRLGQPLGGEVLLNGAMVEALAADPLVRARSDWGIDTIITYVTTTLGLGIYEHNVAEGKRHGLYGALDEIRVMVVECLDAVRSLRGLARPTSRLRAEPTAPVPVDLKQTIAYDFDSTVALLTQNWSAAEVELARDLRPPVSAAILANLDSPNFAFMDAAAWGNTLAHLLHNFTIGDPGWESLAFRLWLTRVLSYTTEQAVLGYDRAIAYLEDTIHRYETLGDEDVSR